jgi:transposase
MHIVTSEVGIDVSKEWLDVCIDGGKPFRVSNTAQDCALLSGRLPKGCVVHLESSGGYERTVSRALRAAQVEVRTHDPLRVRRISQASQGKAKTDLIDARNLSRTGAWLPKRAPKTLEREALADHSRAIDELKATAAEFLVRAKANELDSIAKSAYLEAASFLRLRAQELEQQFIRRVKASSLAQKYELALTVPSVGAAMARVCVSELPEDLSEFSSAQISSYAGLAPLDNSSGKRTGRSQLGRGNSKLKRACYMPAVSAVKSQPWAKSLYSRLRAKGRLHQQAIVAVMRRLLVRVVAVLKRGSPWQGEPISP